MILRIVLAACFMAKGLFSQDPDIVFLNGRVFTGVPDKLWSEAVAVTGSRIQAVGTSEEITALARPKTRRIDLAGRVLVPGFNDAHIHFGPLNGEYTNLPTNNPTCQAALRSVEDAIAKAAEGRPLLVRIGHTAFFDPECTASVLDRIAPRRPVLLRTWTAQAAIVNTAAAEMLGVRKGERPNLGGFFGKDMNSNEWDGVVHEYANFRLSNKLVRYEEQDLRSFLQRAAEFGITTLQIMSWNPARMVELLSKVPPPVRIRVMSYLIPEGRTRPKLAFPKVPAKIADRVTVSGVKWMIDGSPVERSSAFRTPYPDDPSTSGKLNFSDEELRAMFKEAHQRDIQLILHAGGNRAIDAVLETLEATGGKKAWARRRVRIEHSNAIMPDQFTRVRDFGILPVMNPPHFAMGDLQLVRSVLHSGIKLVLASDNAMNPFQNLMFASTYPNKPEEALTREEAVIAYTSTAAYAEFRETENGTIEAGKQADLAILSQNIFEVPAPELSNVRAVLTMVGGKIIHSTQALDDR